MDPINVGSLHPRLSWIDESDTRSWRQGAYQILVSSDSSRLGADKADLWDSGRVDSDESSQIAYAGKPLSARETCWWKVRVWDRDGNVSPWSEPHRWEMGLLKETDWGASQWIGKNRPPGANPAPFLRKQFVVAGKVRRARIYACGLGYADIHVNGRAIAPGIERDPAYTNFDKRILSVGYDVTRLIKPGRNAIGAVLGTGWYDVHDLATWHFDQAPWRDRPKLRLLLAIDTADGKTQLVSSDTSWKTTDGPILRDGIYTGEVYDARKEVPGWDRAGYRADHWQPADEMAVPKGVLVPRACPGVVIGESIKAKNITEPEPGVYIVDFGQNFSGHVRLKLNEPAGTTVRLRYSERLDKNGMIERGEIDTFMAKEDPPQPFQTDTYICRGDGQETWEQRFSYSGFRYAEVTGLPAKPSLDMFEGRFAHTDLESAGAFECSDPMLNKIQRATRYSYLSNAQSIPTDCPQREKNGWTGDAQLAAETGLMNFRSAPFYTKWLDDLSDTESPAGMMSLIVPSGGWGRGDRHPAWDSAFPIVAFDLYRYLGDKTALAKHYDGLKLYVDSLAEQLKDGVVTWDSLGDWVPWKTQTPSTFTSTVYMFVDAEIMRQTAALLGKSEDARHFASLAESVRDGAVRHFYADGTWANGSQTALSMALYFGLAPADDREKTFQALVQNLDAQGHIDTGILGAKYVLRVLSENGRTDLAYKLITRKEQPSWAWWIEQGATTLWEDWKGESSLNHIMFGDVSNWFIQWIAGIGLDEQAPGFSHILIHPQVVGGLTWAKAWHDSPHGHIASSWKLDKDSFHLDVTIPANTTATVTIPFWGPITEGGHPIAQAAGVRLVSADPNKTVLEVGSGTYAFTCPGRA